MYDVWIADPVIEYLRRVEGLSEAGFNTLIEGVVEDLGQNTDHYHRLYPRSHESYSFNYDYALIEGGTAFSFTFVVDTGSTPYGVVRIVFVEASSTPV